VAAKRAGACWTCITMTELSQEAHRPNMSSEDSSVEHRFRTLFEANSRPLLAYALRRTHSPSDAADVVAETMLVAWRRIDDVPIGDEARLWLYGVARLVVVNDRGGAQRQQRLAERLAQHVEAAVRPDLAGSVVANVALTEALARLDEGDRELLRLVTWEGLSPAELAVVLDIPAATVRTKLHRARIRLRTILAADDDATKRCATSGHGRSEGKSPLSPIEEGLR
jgi:RNA polymerase sigma factor (sigma-70 family)